MKYPMHRSAVRSDSSNVNVFVSFLYAVDDFVSRVKVGNGLKVCHPYSASVGQTARLKEHVVECDELLFNYAEYASPYASTKYLLNPPVARAFFNEEFEFYIEEPIHVLGGSKTVIIFYIIQHRIMVEDMEQELNKSIIAQCYECQKTCEGINSIFGRSASNVDEYHTDLLIDSMGGLVGEGLPFEFAVAVSRYFEAAFLPVEAGWVVLNF
ncbi:hypothetical protein M514_01885 [Trichuris suis]|uniref:Uncharacterized protein n=1 Tax=Trichuris suis TaxID=68888 RepID=A0A085NTG7_9BILA|nr:hypothetical protein M514_01885 [Trichuris suis]